MDRQHAFPTENTSPAYAGMTLRDWFAGQALTGIVARMSNESLYPIDSAADGLRYPDGELHGQAQAIAEDAYALAEAMMAVRTTADGLFPQDDNKQLSPNSSDKTNGERGGIMKLHLFRTPEYATCSAWARWIIGIDFGSWGFCIIREQWGFRFKMAVWELTTFAE